MRRRQRIDLPLTIPGHECPHRGCEIDAARCAIDERRQPLVERLKQGFVG
jgi:hypothetical protein